ncbi:MAG: HAD family phosphatase [Chloroflexi bacterium]|nr:HAD family phosphatase [Chloroflexota bacterium]
MATAAHRPGAGPVRAVIFDMDGVLTDSEPFYHEAHNLVLGELGLALSEEENRQILGTTVEHSWRWIAQRFQLPGPLDGWLARYDRAVIEVLSAKAQPSPGLYRLLELLEARRLPLGLASSSQASWVRAILQKLGVEERFKVVISGEMVAHGKPAPDIYLLVARGLGVEPQGCLVFEDTPVGISAARAAGMQVVAVETPSTAGMDLSQAHHVVSSLARFDPAWLEGGA